jgi:hypothetical protein
MVKRREATLSELLASEFRTSIVLCPVEPGLTQLQVTRTVGRANDYYSVSPLRDRLVRTRSFGFRRRSAFRPFLRAMHDRLATIC